MVGPFWLKTSLRALGDWSDMTEEMVITISSQMFKTLFMIAGPMLAVGLVVGLIVSILQTITQINEATLTFVPKILSIILVLAVAGPWMMDQMLTYTRELINQIPFLVR